MKKIFTVLALVLSFNLSLAIDLSGSSFDYDLNFSSVKNYKEKDGEATLKLNFDGLSLKYSADILEGATEDDTSMEVLYSKVIGNRVKFSVDGEIITKDGFHFQLDEDSEKTYVKLGLTKNLILGLYPLNFGSNVGDELESEDVTKIYYIQGHPTILNGSTKGITVDSKTVPGMIVTYKFNRMFSIYGGIGAVDYDVPGDEKVDLNEEPNSYYWKKQIDMAYKAGFKYDNEISKLSFDFVGHDESSSGGSLLEYAGALMFSIEPGSLELSGEAVYTKAGENPYYVDGSTLYKAGGYYPYYTQDFVGEGDFGASLKVAYELSSELKPYIKAKYIGENFIYDGDYSSHKLRTIDEGKQGYNYSNSHGGLNIAEVGIEMNYFKAVVNPYFEYIQSENPVFESEDDLNAKEDNREDDLDDSAYTVGVKVKYNF